MPMTIKRGRKNTLARGKKVLERKREKEELKAIGVKERTDDGLLDSSQIAVKKEASESNADKPKPIEG